MPPDDQSHFVQLLAFSLVLLGMIGCGIGDWMHFTTLANNGGIVIGAGCGILTGQKLQQLTTKGGGDIVNPPADAKDS